MEKKHERALRDFVDLDRYPLLDPACPAYVAKLASIRADLARDGCSVLRGFLRGDALDRLQREGDTVA